MAAALDVLTGAAIEPALPDIARLRIAVFRDFPYLYDGSLDYEREYLSAFAATPGAVIVACGMAGGSSGRPPACRWPPSMPPFAILSPAPASMSVRFFTAPSSVLLPDYRGRGLGAAFFDVREAHARALGLRVASFCAVIRPADHPAMPPDYRPLDSFWRRRGYAPVPSLVASYSWRDLGAAEETAKPLQFWMKALG